MIEEKLERGRTENTVIQQALPTLINNIVYTGAEKMIRETEPISQRMKVHVSRRHGWYDVFLKEKVTANVSIEKLPFLLECKRSRSRCSTA
jgi:hypothetical protein